MFIRFTNFCNLQSNDVSDTTTFGFIEKIEILCVVHVCVIKLPK